MTCPISRRSFLLGSSAMLETAKEGQAIEFVAERVRGKLTVVEMK